MGRPHPELRRRLWDDATLGTGNLTTVFVPGAGTGNDAIAFASAGWQVTAVDIADAVAPTLHERLDSFGATVGTGDALAFGTESPFGLVFDHTFFCAIEPSRRPEFGSMCSRTLAPGGSVVSIVFPIGRPDASGGPPWTVDVDALSGSLGDRFVLAEASEPFRTKGRSYLHQWARWDLDD